MKQCEARAIVFAGVSPYHWDMSFIEGVPQKNDRAAAWTRGGARCKVVGPRLRQFRLYVEEVENAEEVDRKRLAFALRLKPEAGAQEIADEANGLCRREEGRCNVSR